MKSSKIWKIIWVVGIYSILGLILYLVILYKVEWEDKDLSTYLYFYDCNNTLCTSTTKQNDYYNKIKCEKDICPYITAKINENVILKNENKSWIYNYITDTIVNEKYIDYKIIENNQFIVTDTNNNQGIIDIDGTVIVEPKYSNINNYNNGFISYIKDNKHGLQSIDEKHLVEATYEDIVLINDLIFSGKKENIYKIYNMDNSEYSEENYNYIYAYSDIIIVANNKKIDILTTDLKSTLLMKIDTFFEYKTEKERESLNIHIEDDKYISFTVYINETEYQEYKYDVYSKKLI